MTKNCLKLLKNFKQQTLIYKMCNNKNTNGYKKVN